MRVFDSNFSFTKYSKMRFFGSGPCGLPPYGVIEQVVVRSKEGTCRTTCSLKDPILTLYSFLASGTNSKFFLSFGYLQVHAQHKTLLTGSERELSQLTYPHQALK